MLSSEVLLEKLATILNLLVSILKLVHFLKNLSVDEERLDLDVQLRHELVLSLLRAHSLEGFGLLLDFGECLDGALSSFARILCRFHGFR